jgi:hypothetical protein
MLNLMSFSPSNFGRYVSQTDYDMDESNDIKERTQTQQKLITTNNIPSLMSLTVTPPPIITTNIQQKSVIPPSVIKENIEPLPFPQHGPGPIQRPNKLSCSSTAQLSTFLADSTQSPSTPDVLDQINHLLDHQNSITTIPSTPNVSNSSALINDISTPNVPWTPFSSTEWSSKYDASWPNSNVSQMQNPFAQRQMSKEESAVWLSGLGSTTTSSNNSWLKFLPVSEPPSVDSITSNKQETEPTNPFWNSINLNEWSKTPSDENNNDHDQSRWDFAR